MNIYIDSTTSPKNIDDVRICPQNDGSYAFYKAAHSGGDGMLKWIYMEHRSSLKAALELAFVVITNPPRRCGGPDGRTDGLEHCMLVQGHRGQCRGESMREEMPDLPWFGQELEKHRKRFKADLWPGNDSPIPVKPEVGELFEAYVGDDLHMFRCETWEGIDCITTCGRSFRWSPGIGFKL